jgi:hypothetical protein
MPALPEIFRGAEETDDAICRARPRRALGLAQVIQMAMREGDEGALRDYPEGECAQPRPRRQSKRAVILGAIAGGLIVAGGIWGLDRKSPRKRMESSGHRGMCLDRRFGHSESSEKLQRGDRRQRGGARSHG